jgi:hypothetical protein
MLAAGLNRALTAVSVSSVQRCRRIRPDLKETPDGIHAPYLPRTTRGLLLGLDQRPFIRYESSLGQREHRTAT